MRRGPALAGLALLSLLLAGCGLPLADGVHRPGEVPAEQRLPQPINVLPPGPQPGATPEEVVLAFLAAQSSARDQHRIARSFLAPAARADWHDDAGVTVYDPRTATTGPAQPDVAGGVTVTLSIDVLGAVGADGAARVQPAQSRTQRYRLRQDTGPWQLVSVPDGLTLSAVGRDRSYDPVSIYFLAPLGPGPVRRHLVADLVELPADQDRAQQVVARLVAGPSTGLGASGASAVPPGTRLRTPVSTSASGEVTVDLAMPAEALAGTDRADLSAQLVWSLKDALPDFTRLRLLVGGAPLQVPGIGTPQPRSAWGSYVPDGPDSSAGLALVGGSLRSLLPVGDDDDPPALPAVTGAVDLAVDSRRARIAVLTDDGGTTTLLTGPQDGPLTAGLQDPGLRSPTWGSGDLGLFLLRTGPRPAVLLVPPSGPPVEVQVDGLPALDGSALLRVSRDGTRVALVAGGVLQVGRLELGGKVPHLVALRRLATGVLDVAWRTGTTLEVLVRDDVPPLLPLLQVSVDGISSQPPTGLVGVAEGDPVSLAAYGDQPLLVETSANGRSTVYSGDGADGFQVELRDATRPSYAR